MSGGTVLTLVLLACLPASMHAEGDPASALAAGDEAFFRMDYSGAITFYTAAVADHSHDAEALWKLARACVCKGEVLEGNERLEQCKRAEMFARQCIAQDSSISEGHCWLAAALGYIALDAGKHDQIALAHELLSEVDRAIQLNPDNDAAYSIKGSFYRALGNVGWLQRQLAALFVGRIPKGGYEEAEVALKTAVALAPDVMRHKYELGILYLDMDRNDEARAMLEQAAALPVKVAIDRPRLAKIREILSTLPER